MHLLVAAPLGFMGSQQFAQRDVVVAVDEQPHDGLTHLGRIRRQTQGRIKQLGCAGEVARVLVVQTHNAQKLRVFPQGGNRFVCGAGGGAHLVQQMLDLRPLAAADIGRQGQDQVARLEGAVPGLHRHICRLQWVVHLQQPDGGIKVWQLCIGCGQQLAIRIQRHCVTLLALSQLPGHAQEVGGDLCTGDNGMARGLQPGHGQFRLATHHRQGGCAHRALGCGLSGVGQKLLPCL